MIVTIKVRDAILRALHELHRIEAEGEAAKSPQVNVERTAAEIFEVAVIERFENVIGKKLGDWLAEAQPPATGTHGQSCVATRLPLRLAHGAGR